MPDPPFTVEFQDLFSMHTVYDLLKNPILSGPGFLFYNYLRLKPNGRNVVKVSFQSGFVNGRNDGSLTQEEIDRLSKLDGMLWFFSRNRLIPRTALPRTGDRDWTYRLPITVCVYRLPGI